MASRVCRTSARSSGKKVKVMSMASVSTRGRRIQEKPRRRLSALCAMGAVLL